MSRHTVSKVWLGWNVLDRSHDDDQWYGTFVHYNKAWFRATPEDTMSPHELG